MRFSLLSLPLFFLIGCGGEPVLPAPEDPCVHRCEAEAEKCKKRVNREAENCTHLSFATCLTNHSVKTLLCKKQQEKCEAACGKTRPE